MNLLEPLKRWTTVVADTGDIEAIAEDKPQDATTKMHNEDAMTTEKLAEGIRHFYAEARKLEQFAQTRVTQKMAS